MLIGVYVGTRYFDGALAEEGDPIIGSAGLGKSLEGVSLIAARLSWGALR